MRVHAHICAAPHPQRRAALPAEREAARYSHGADGVQSVRILYDCQRRRQLRSGSSS